MQSRSNCDVYCVRQQARSRVIWGRTKREEAGRLSARSRTDSLCCSAAALSVFLLVEIHQEDSWKAKSRDNSKDNTIDISFASSLSADSK